MTKVSKSRKSSISDPEISGRLENTTFNVSALDLLTFSQALNKMDAIGDENQAFKQSARDEYKRKKDQEKEVLTAVSSGKNHDQDFNLYKYRQVSRKLLSDTRHSYCGCRIISKSTDPEVWTTKTDRVAYKQLIQCGSPWICPVCRFKIMNYRQAELLLMLQFAENQGYNFGHLVLTTDHKRDTDARELIKKMSKVFRVILGHRRMSKFNFGLVKNMEVTHGVNGFHPHFHIIIMGLEGHDKLGEIADQIKTEWLSRFPGATEINQRYRPVYNSVTQDREIGEYITKTGLAWEMVPKTGSKKSREGLNPIQIPAMIQKNDLGNYSLEQLTAIYRQYYQVTKGMRTINYNDVARGLKLEALTIFGLTEKDDQEITHDDSDMLHLVLKIQPEVFRQLVKGGNEVEFLKDVSQLVKENKPYSFISYKWEAQLKTLLEFDGVRLQFQAVPVTEISDQDQVYTYNEVSHQCNINLKTLVK